MKIGSYGNVIDNPMRSKSIWTIYHNPRCSKSRCALDLLREKGIDAQVIEYLETPLKASELQQLLGLLKVEPQKLLRTNESIFKTLTIDVNDKNAVIEAIMKHPILLERPIIVHDGKAVIGRPPERVWEIL